MLLSLSNSSFIYGSCVRGPPQHMHLTQMKEQTGEGLFLTAVAAFEVWASSSRPMELADTRETHRQH
uniref:Uncharacterized protein n=1 Tax=Knipowitschia caucasica TaxID=637954 RepID=A0AAV2LF86_KNICA